MAHHPLFGLLVLCALLFLEASCRPSNNESKTPISEEQITDSEEERLLKEEEKYSSFVDNSKEILDKIKLINAGLKKPARRQQIKTDLANVGGYVLNRDTLEKLQQVIASGKLQPLLEAEKYQENNDLNDLHTNVQRYSKSLPYLPNAVLGNQISSPLMPLPYVTNIPVLVMPTANAYNPSLGNEYTQTAGNAQYQTRQGLPSLPSFQWPLAPYFPILIKDPILAVLQGGGWSNIFEVGQSADVCSRKQKTTEESIKKFIRHASEYDIDIDNDMQNELLNSREGRGLKKRNISKSTITEEDIKTEKKMEKFFTKTTTTQKPMKHHPVSSEEPPKKTKNNNEDDDALRFGAFTFFGDKKPVAPSPGFFINKLKVRRGGVAIAGPGGVATAGRGGTAIVGPGGLAYTQPGGLAVAGPAARVVALSPETNLSSIIAQLQQLSAKDGSLPRLLNEIPEGKVVATGPVIYYHSNSNDQS